VLENVDELERDPASYKELLLSDALEMPKSA
jgi:hypothetical protein